MHECICTGIAFCDANQQRWWWGDLHQLGNILIFNGTGNTWSHEEMQPNVRAVLCPVYFEKNNLVVFPLELARFNQEAHDYIQADMPEPSRIVRLQ